MKKQNLKYCLNILLTIIMFTNFTFTAQMSDREAQELAKANEISKKICAETESDAYKAKCLALALATWKEDSKIDNPTKVAINILEKLDINLATYVISFLNCDKYIGGHMQKLIPALMNWKNNLNNVIYTLDKTQFWCSNDNTKRAIGYFERANYSYGNHSRNLTVEDISAICRKDPYSFLANSSPSGKVIYKVCPRKLKELQNLTENQLIFIASLWDQRKKQIQEVIILHNLQDHYTVNTLATIRTEDEALFSDAQRIDFTPEQQNKLIHLPDEMIKNLIANYCPPVVVAAPAAADADEVEDPELNL